MPPSRSTFAAAVSNPKSVVEHYKDFDDYDATVVTEYGYSAHQRVPSAILARVGANKRLRVLDLGCGTGLSSALFLDNGHAVVGVDVSEQMIQQAREKGSYERLECCSVQEAVSMLAGEHFDVVVLIGVMEFIADPSAFLQSLVPLLAATGGGASYLGIAVPEKQPAAVERRFEILTHEPEPMLTAMSEAGLTLVYDESFVGYDLGSSIVGYRGFCWEQAHHDSH